MGDTKSIISIVVQNALIDKLRSALNELDQTIRFVVYCFNKTDQTQPVRNQT